MTLEIPRKRGRGKPTSVQIEETRALLAQLEAQHRQEQEAALEHNRKRIIEAITAANLDAVPVIHWIDTMSSIADLLRRQGSEIPSERAADATSMDTPAEQREASPTCGE